MLPKFEIKVEEKVFVKDPASSELGRKIITHSIEIIDELGFEKFTFRKLAQGIKSTEPSIYRYFENKHKLLLYLLSWYWNWLDYQIIFHTHNITDSSERLERALRILSEPAEFDPNLEL